MTSRSLMAIITRISDARAPPCNPLCRYPPAWRRVSSACCPNWLARYRPRPYARSEERRVGKEWRSRWATCRSSRRRHTRSKRDWSSDVCSSDLFLTTLHSVMNDQPVIDGYHHPDLRRTRSAMQSIVPVSTGLAQGVERLLPELAGKVQAKAIR